MTRRALHPPYGYSDDVFDSIEFGDGLYRVEFWPIFRYGNFDTKSWTYERTVLGEPSGLELVTEGGETHVREFLELNAEVTAEVLLAKCLCRHPGNIPDSHFDGHIMAPYADHFPQEDGGFIVFHFENGDTRAVPFRNNLVETFAIRTNPVAALMAANQFEIIPHRRVGSNKLFDWLNCERPPRDVPVIRIGHEAIEQLENDVTHLSYLVGNGRDLVAACSNDICELIYSPEGEPLSAQSATDLVDSLLHLDPTFRPIVEGHVKDIANSLNAASQVYGSDIYLDGKLYSQPGPSENAHVWLTDFLRMQIWGHARDKQIANVSNAQMSYLVTALAVCEQYEDVTELQDPLDYLRNQVVKQALEQRGLQFNKDTLSWDAPTDETNYTDFDAERFLHDLRPDLFNAPVKKMPDLGLDLS